jgi:hypothetical protein
VRKDSVRHQRSDAAHAVHSFNGQWLAMRVKSLSLLSIVNS